MQTGGKKALRRHGLNAAAGSPKILLGTYIGAILVSLPLTPTVVNFLKARGYLEAAVIAIAAAVVAAAGYGLHAHLRVRDLRFYSACGALVATAGVASLLVETVQERLHIPEYAVMAILVGQVLKGRYSGARLYLGTFVGAAVLGILDECVQYFLPMRVCDVRDMAFNAQAAALGTAFFALFQRTRQAQRTAAP